MQRHPTTPFLEELDAGLEGRLFVYFFFGRGVLAVCGENGVDLGLDAEGVGYEGDGGEGVAIGAHRVRRFLH